VLLWRRTHQRTVLSAPRDLPWDLCTPAAGRDGLSGGRGCWLPATHDPTLVDRRLSRLLLPAARQVPSEGNARTGRMLRTRPNGSARGESSRSCGRCPLAGQRAPAPGDEDCAHSAPALRPSTGTSAVRILEDGDLGPRPPLRRHPHSARSHRDARPARRCTADTGAARPAGAEARSGPKSVNPRRPITSRPTLTDRLGLGLRGPTRCG
jgi:hypothetical protein